jgi:hypothetical protein
VFVVPVMFVILGFAAAVAAKTAEVTTTNRVVIANNHRRDMFPSRVLIPFCS